jgi:predicted transcriptional regulator of viral defense system
MKDKDSKVQNVIQLFKERGGILRTSEILAENVHPRTLYRMRDEGVLIQLERGVYKLSDSQSLSNPDLAMVAVRIPSAKICLISALDFHGMTKEIPHKVHIALSRSQRNPKLDHPPIEVYRFAEDSLNSGVEEHSIDGQQVQIYNPAKTIADCFKFRNQIGLEVALEALQNGVKQGKASFSEILEYAKVCRVQNVMKPYLESIINE